MSIRTFFIAVIALASLLLGACYSRPIALTFAAPSYDLDHEIAEDLAAVLDQGSRFAVDLTPQRYSGDDALDMLLRGDADIALISNYLPYREGIATIMPLYPSVLHVLYRDGRDASNAYTLLNGARILAGAEGSASRLMLERVFARLELPADAYTYVDPDVDIAIAKPDVAVVFAPISPQRLDDLPGYVMFSIGTPADIGSGSLVDAAKLVNPHTRPFIIPESTYGAATPSAVVTLAVDKILVARSNLDASIVYDFINEIRRLRPALAATRPGLFAQLGDDFDASVSTFVLHSGAQKFLHRAEPTIYERYSGVAEVVVTLMLALASAGLAALRIFKVRRKNRIDRFYSAVIAIRDSVKENSSEADLAQARAKIADLQTVAFGQLVDEKLSADESFQIFVTLSNDAIRQLHRQE